MVRAPFYDKNGVKKGAWSCEEDEKLRSYIQKFGHWNWRELPKYAGLERCGKSCRLRWMNYLRPDVKHGNFTEEEDALIIRLHQQHGNRWSIIAASLPGRTDNEIKNHWHTSLKNRANRNSASSTTDSPISESPYTTTTTSECEAESLVIDVAPNMILESSHYLSPSTSSTVEFSTFSPVHSDYTSNSLNNLSAVIEDPTCLASCSSSLEIYEDQRGGDFWTEPFVADNVYNQDGLIDMPLNYDVYDDDSADLQFYQMMQGWGLD